MNDLKGKNIPCFLVKPVLAEISDVFDRSVNTARDVLRRLMGYLPVQMEAVPRQLLEGMTLRKEDTPRVQKFFESEYHHLNKQLTKDLVTDIESWVIQRLDEKFVSNKEVNLVEFLVELNEEQETFYGQWSNRRLQIEKALSVQEDLTDYLPEDLAKVNSLNLPDNILDHDRMILATLYRVKQEKKAEILFSTTDYSIILARSIIEKNLGFQVTDPLYAIHQI